MKQVLITGISGGIGSALAKTFREAGYYVFGIDLAEKYSGYCDRFFQLDLNKFCTNARYRIEQTGLLDQYVTSLDVLINNAAVQRLDKFENLKLDDWQETLNVNLTAPMILSKIFLSRLKKNKGSIINIASIHQDQTKKEFVSYSTSKSALIGFTKSLAVDLNGVVRVNAISPAAIKTQMLLDGFGGDEKVLKKLNQVHPTQRIGTPEEVAEVAIFLSSNKAGFINGSNIKLDGGISSVLADI